MCSQIQDTREVIRPRLAIASGRALIRYFAAHVTRADFGATIVAELTGAADLISRHEVLASADVLVIDAVSTSRVIDAIELVARSHPHCRILVLWGATGDWFTSRAKNAGATGLVHETDHGSEWLAALQAVLRGGFYLSSQTETHRRSKAVMESLTARQEAVFVLSSRGFTDEEVGVELGLKTSTVETHRAAVRRNLGLPDFAAFLIAGVRLGVTAIADVNVSRRTRRTTRGSRSGSVIQTPNEAP